MNKIFNLIVIILIFGCGQKKSKSEEKKPIIESENKLGYKLTELKNTDTSINFGDIPSSEKIEFNKPAILIVTMDSLEVEQTKKIDGKDNFYTATDDLMWYNAMLQEKMDSLNIDVKYTEKDTVYIKTSNINKTIIKDSTFTVYTYFYFDGQKLNRTELFKLQGE